MSEPAPRGVLVLDDVVVLRLGGSQARAFLSRQLTCDVSGLAPGRPLFGAWLTPKGRALALLRVLDAGDGSLRAVLPAELADEVAARMRLFILRDDVHIERSDEEAVAGLMGEAVARSAASATGGWRVALADSPALSLLVAARDRVERARAALEAEGVPTLGAEQWRLQLVRAGIPEVHAATREAFVPQMINLDVLGAVSFRKGCYPGQEIVARTQHLGRIKRRAFLARCEASQPRAAPGDPLAPASSSDTPGRVVRAAADDAGQEMLAVLPLDAVASGEEFHLGSAEGPAVTVSRPPYPLEVAGR